MALSVRFCTNWQVFVVITPFFILKKKTSLGNSELHVSLGGVREGDVDGGVDSQDPQVALHTFEAGG